MRVGFGFKLGMAISLVSLGSTGFGVAYLYTAMRANIWAQMEHRVRDVARAGLFLLGPRERRTIESLRQTATRRAQVSRAHLDLPPGESRDTLSKEEIAALQAGGDFQELVQQLRKIKNAARQKVVLEKKIPQGVLDPTDPPLIRFVYILTAIPESPSRDFVMFLADADYESLDDNKNGVIDAAEQPTSIGMIYNASNQDGLKQAFLGVVTANSSYTVDKWGTWVSAFVPVHGDSGKVVAVMGIDYSAETELRLVRWLRLLCGAILTAGIAFSLLASVAVSRKLGRPLHLLRSGALRARDGDYAVRIPITSRDEIGVLSEAFNDMMGRVQKYAGDLEAALERIQRVDQVKDQFLSNLSHELNTPLTIIMGYAELIKNNEPLPPDIRDAIHSIHAQSLILGGYIADLMLLTQLETGVPIETEEIDLRGAIAAGLRSLESQIQLLNIQVEEHYDRDSVCIGDPILLKKAIQHVLSNAVMFNRNNGRLIVSVRKEESRTAIIIEDTGRGIWPEDLERIWEKFYRVDNSTSYTVRGVGLGLFVSRRIVELHGGSITVESEPEKGSRFKILL